jgi:hypothetical protein
MNLSPLNRVLGYDQLSLEEKIRRAVRAAKLEMTPAWTEAMRALPPYYKAEGANELFLMARDALYFQERRKGLSERDAKLVVAQRLLNSNDW